MPKNKQIAIDSSTAPCVPLVYDLRVLAWALGGVSQWTAADLVRRGEIPRLRLPAASAKTRRRDRHAIMRRVFVRVIDVEAYLEKLAKK